MDDEDDDDDDDDKDDNDGFASFSLEHLPNWAKQDQEHMESVDLQL